jgi:hypothetical protein
VDPIIELVYIELSLAGVYYPNIHSRTLLNSLRNIPMELFKIIL